MIWMLKLSNLIAKSDKLIEAIVSSPHPTPKVIII